MVPVYVQYPCKPKTLTHVGCAGDNLTVEAVARVVGVPDGCLLDGKLTRRKGERRWHLIAFVTFGEHHNMLGGKPCCT